MSFKQGFKELVINSAASYPVRFYNAAGVEQTAIADIASNATSMWIQSYGKFTLSQIRNVIALRGFNSAQQVSTLREADLTIAALSATSEEVAFNFRVRDYSYSSRFAQARKDFGIDKRYQVIYTSTSKPAMFAKLFNQISADILDTPNGPKDIPFTTQIVSGSDVTYLDSTGALQGPTTLGADYNPGDLIGGNVVSEFVTIAGATVNDPAIRIIGFDGEISVSLRVEDSYLAISDKVTASLVRVSEGTEGRNTGTYLQHNYVLETVENNMPYFPVFNDQRIDPTCLYTNINFSTIFEDSFGGHNVLNAIQTREAKFDIMIKEDATNLNGTTGVIAKILTFLAKDGKYTNGYTFYNQDYQNPLSATKDAVLSGNNATAWNESTHSGVIRTGVDGVSPQLTADVADFVDDVQGS